MKAILLGKKFVTLSDEMFEAVGKSWDLAHWPEKQELIRRAHAIGAKQALDGEITAVSNGGCVIIRQNDDIL